MINDRKLEHGCPRCGSDEYETHGGYIIMEYPSIIEHSFVIAGETVKALFRYPDHPSSTYALTHAWGRGRLECVCKKCGFPWAWETSNWWTW